MLNGKELSAKAVAAYLIKKSDAMGDGIKEFSGNNDLTNLKLQKILYFIQVQHLKDFGTPLFADEIEAWQYGPVVASIYEWLSHCGPYVITQFDIDNSAADEVDQESTKFIDGVWEKCNKYSAWTLVNKTHEANSAWSKVYNGGKGNHKVISLELLAKAETI